MLRFIKDVVVLQDTYKLEEQRRKDEYNYRVS